MPRALRHSPQTLSRGKQCCSIRATRQRARDRRIAASDPAGPPPMIVTSGIRAVFDLFYGEPPVPQLAVHRDLWFE